MTPEQLMQPRFKVIADYPNNPHTVGATIQYVNSMGQSVDYYKQHPHLYREMGWWEERAEEGMPMYVKIIEDIIHTSEVPYFAKVYSIMKMGIHAYGFKLKGGTDGMYSGFSAFLPATEAEYIASIGQSK